MRGAVHHAHARNVQTVEDLVQQRRVAARCGDVEGVQNAVLEDIHFVDVGALRQLTSFAAHVPHVEHDAPGQLPSQRGVPVLDIASLPAAVRHVDALRAAVVVVNGNGGHRGNRRQRQRQRHLAQALIRGGRNRLRLAQAGRAISVELVQQREEVLFIRDAISRAKYRLILAQPGQRPRESQRGSEVAIIRLPGLHARVRRVLADQLQLHQRSGHIAGIELGGEGGSGDPEDALRPADEIGHSAMRFVRNAIILPPDAQVNSQVIADFDIVLEVSSPLVRVPGVLLLAEGQILRIRSARRVEHLR